MMTVADVAARLNVSPAFVYGLLRNRLKHYRLGRGQGGIRVSEEQLQAYLRESEQGSDQPRQAAPSPKARPFRPKHLKI